jgi:predicted RND superfamily exporter protein
MTLLPALLLLTDGFNGGTRMRGARLTRRLCLSMALAPRRWIGVSAAAALIILAIALASIGRVGLASDLSILHPRPNPPLDAQSEISTRMGIVGGSVFVHLEAASSEELLRRAHQVDRALAEEPVRRAGVTSRFGLASLLPDPERRQDLPLAPGRVVADFREQLRLAGFNPARFEAYETFLDTLLSPRRKPDVEALTAYPEVARLVLSRGALAGDAATEAITLVFFDQPLDDRAARTAAIDALREAVSDLPGVTVTGLSPISMDVDAAIRRDLPRLIALAVGLITVYLVFHLRSFLLALLVVTPTIISFLAVLAWMVASGQSWNLVNIVMLPLLLGINVDYGIFAAAAWKGAGFRRDLLTRFRAGVPGVFVCCLTTVLGFGSLVSTSIPAVQSLGSLIIVGITTCLAATACLVWPAMFLGKTPGPRGT